MWSYYGRKSKVIKYYPNPIKNKIIEPFAGTAVYSLHGDNWKKDVTIVDKYEIVYKIWKYLQRANPKDILSLPNLEYGDRTDNYEYLSDEERWLIGFCINRGNATPCIKANNYNSWAKDKVRIAENLHKIKHWNILCEDYRNIQNEDATWFIDPPYFKGGYKYKHNNIDYEELSNWCKERIGQVIVCENTNAKWMDFKPLKEMRGQQFTTTEAIWYIEDNNKSYVDKPII